MNDYYQMLRFDDVRHFLLSGHPPVIIQLIAFNTVLLAVVILRRARATHKARNNVTVILQWCLITINIAVLCQEQWVPYLETGRDVMMNRISDVIRPY